MAPLHHGPTTPWPHHTMAPLPIFSGSTSPNTQPETAVSCCPCSRTAKNLFTNNLSVLRYSVSRQFALVGESGFPILSLAVRAKGVNQARFNSMILRKRSPKPRILRGNTLTGSNKCSFFSSHSSYWDTVHSRPQRSGHVRDTLGTRSGLQKRTPPRSDASYRNQVI